MKCECKDESDSVSCVAWIEEGVTGYIDPWRSSPSNALKIYPRVFTDTGVSDNDKRCSVPLRRDKLARKLLRPTDVRSGLRSRTRVWRDRLVCNDVSRAFRAWGVGWWSSCGDCMMACHGMAWRDMV